jgi:hypothetical protein
MNFNELVKRAIKYIIEGIIVALAAYVIPKHTLNVEEVVVIARAAARAREIGNRRDHLLPI